MTPIFIEVQNILLALEYESYYLVHTNVKEKILISLKLFNNYDINFGGNIDKLDLSKYIDSIQYKLKYFVDSGTISKL